MEFIRRRIYLDKFLKPIDTDGDGNFDALRFEPTDKILQIHLTQTIDDMGLMTQFVDTTLFQTVVTEAPNEDSDADIE